MRTPNCGNGAWVPIDYERYWQLFDKQFHFRAGVEADSWPAIAEPAGSMVFDLSPIFGRPPREAAIEMDYVDEAVVAALVNVLQPGERAVVLDCQHQSFSFDPGAVKPGVPDDLVVTPFPDGDYHAFLTPDMAAGTFGHPWERTLCVFGGRLVDSVSESLSTWLPVRRDNRR